MGNFRSAAAQQALGPSAAAGVEAALSIGAYDLLHGHCIHLIQFIDFIWSSYSGKICRAIGGAEAARPVKSAAGHSIGGMRRLHLCLG